MPASRRFVGSWASFSFHSMPLIDTHLHLWDLDQFPYPWTAGLPALNRTFDLAEYRAQNRGPASGLTVTSAVFMECDVAEVHQLDEARHIQVLADAQDDRFIPGLIASCRPEHDAVTFADHLAALCDLPKLRGLRRILHTSPDELSAPAAFAANLNQLVPHGLTFDLCVLARQLPVARSLAARCPDVTFILDHCGVPDVKGQALAPWRDELAHLAELPNVNCKVSGLVAYADNTRWTVDDLRPFFDHVVATFGWDRIVWGGDWPVCTLSTPLSGWLDATAELTATATDEQRAALFHQNATRLYRL